MDGTMIKVVIGGVSAFVSYVVGGIGIALTVLLGLMLIDIITGLLVGATGEGVRSSVGIKGLVKKAYVLLLIGSVYMVQNLAEFEFAGYTGDGLAILFAIMEFISIIENGGKLGVKLPQKFYDIVAVLKDRVEK